MRTLVPDPQGGEHVRAQDPADPCRHLGDRAGHAVQDDPGPVPSRLQEQMTVALVSLNRILHRILVFDNEYLMWESH
ncbi:hypothetical protein CDAR_493701 [Caerostris darwini]|uniref:Uncharacterized protein n=1 Tax=Caerostris darwini TaxID=1538125 RepID=A0AAV4VUD5_9ARAC|nr:hypothetical protein CDAR_493701 [Caerostris darwini]